MTVGKMGRNQAGESSHAVMLLLCQTTNEAMAFKMSIDFCKNTTITAGKLAKLYNLEQTSPDCPHCDIQLLAMPKAVVGKNFLKLFISVFI
jgi:hypothetical protein